MTLGTGGRPSRRIALVYALALAGCQGSGSSELHVVAAEGCSDSDPAVVYRLTELHVPTRADVAAGAPLGHDLDGVEGACEVPDYEGGVDNSLIDIAAALPVLTPEDPLVLQDLMDQALFCTAADPGCVPQWVGVRVQECRRGAKVDVFRVAQGVCEGLGTAVAADVGRGGALHAEFATLALDRAFEDSRGAHELFALVDARLTGTLTADGLTDAVLGGVVPFDYFEYVVPYIFPDLVEFEVIGPVFNLSDIAREPGGACDGLSMGFTLSAAVEAEGESCE